MITQLIFQKSKPGYSQFRILLSDFNLVVQEAIPKMNLEVLPKAVIGIIHYKVKGSTSTIDSIPISIHDETGRDLGFIDLYYWEYLK